MENKSVLKALVTLYGTFPEHFRGDIYDDIVSSLLTENATRSGRGVLWYADEGYEVAIYIDTLEILSEEEIVRELV